MMKNIMMLIIFITLLSTITFGCVESSTTDSTIFTPKNRVDVTLRTVDIGFRDGSYQQVTNVMSWQTVEQGTFSHTVDMKIINQNYYAETIRIHYVTSIDIMEERTITLELDDRQYQSIMNS